MDAAKFEIEGSTPRVDAALRRTLGVGPKDALAASVEVGDASISLGFDLTEPFFDTRLGDFQGMEVYTRKVTVSAIPRRLAKWRWISDGKREALVQRAGAIVGEVKREVEVEPLPRRHVLSFNGPDLGFYAAMTEDMVSGCLPFHLDGDTLRRESGEAVGTLTMQHYVGFSRSVEAKLGLSEATKPEITIMARAMRAWIRGHALSDIAPVVPVLS